MTKKRIQELAEFFYSLKWRRRTPLRIACTTGDFSGFDISKRSFIELMTILSKSSNLKVDLEKFRQVKEG